LVRPTIRNVVIIPRMSSGPPQIGNCDFVPKSALVITGKRSEELSEECVKVEREISHTVRQDMVMAEIQEVVDSGFSVNIAGTWNM